MSQLLVNLTVWWLTFVESDDAHCFLCVVTKIGTKYPNLSADPPHNVEMLLVFLPLAYQGDPLYPV